MELVNRNTCYFSKDKGGISLVDVRMKIASIQMCQISKIIYNKTLSWTAFGDFWLGIQLKKFSDYDFSNSIPHCIEDKPNYYDSLSKVLNFICNLDSDIIPAKNARCRSFYLKLLNVFMEKNELVVVQKFKDIDFTKVFLNVSNRTIDPLIVNVSYKLAHGVLPVADRLNSFGINIDKLCTFCKKENETMPHLFVYCTHIQWCKKYIASWIFDVCKLGISKNLILFTSSQKDIARHNLKTVLILLSEYRFCIWTSRNKMRYDKKHQTPLDIASLFMRRIKSRILIDFHRLQIVTFQNIWLHDTLCSIKNGEIDFNFY